MPMWPESDKVKGQMNMNRNDCEQLSKNVNKVIHSDAKDGFGNKLNDKFWFFKLYYSPGFDARRY